MITKLTMLLIVLFFGNLYSIKLKSRFPIPSEISKSMTIIIPFYQNGDGYTVPKFHTYYNNR